LSRAPNWTDSP